jgi:hypothetical protein
MKEENLEKFREFVKENGVDAFVKVAYELCKEKEEQLATMTQHAVEMETKLQELGVPGYEWS